MNLPSTGNAPQSPRPDLQIILEKHGSAWSPAELRLVQEWMVATQLKRMLYRIVLLLARRGFYATREDAEDIAQHVFGIAFTAIARNYDPLRATGNFEGYFFRCVCYYCWDWADQRSRMICVPFDESEDAIWTGADIDEQIDNKRRIDRLMMAPLKQREREYLLLRLEGSSLGAIAQKLGISYEAAKKLQQRLVEKLWAYSSEAGRLLGDTSERDKL